MNNHFDDISIGTGTGGALVNATNSGEVRALVIGGPTCHTNHGAGLDAFEK